MIINTMNLPCKDRNETMCWIISAGSSNIEQPTPTESRSGESAII